MRNAMPRRRTVLRWSVAFLAPGLWAQRSSSADKRWLRLYAVNTRERLDVVYWRDGEYVKESLRACDHLLRDHRTNTQTEMDPRLYDLLFQLANRLGTDAPFHVISGYRSAKTNEKRAATPGSGVAKDSLHVQGKAVDIRLPGIDLQDLRDAAMALGIGGVGYYPDSNFVHVDLGRVRKW